MTQGGDVEKGLAAFQTLLRHSTMLAYLSMMAPRLVELRRVLKPTGSIYLHCDPTASHYLKLLMDAVFGAANFRNEIIWHYTGGGRSKSYFWRKHDTILDSVGDDFVMTLDRRYREQRTLAGSWKSGAILRWDVGNRHTADGLDPARVRALLTRTRRTAVRFEARVRSTTRLARSGRLMCRPAKLRFAQCGALVLHSSESSAMRSERSA